MKYSDQCPIDVTSIYMVSRIFVSHLRPEPCAPGFLFQILLSRLFTCTSTFSDTRLFPIHMAVLTKLKILMNRMLNLENLLLSLPPPMLTVYLLHCCGENKRSSKLLHAVIGLWEVYFIFAARAAFTEGFYYVTPRTSITEQTT